MSARIGNREMVMWLALMIIQAGALMSVALPVVTIFLIWLGDAAHAERLLRIHTSCRGI